MPNSACSTSKLNAQVTEIVTVVLVFIWLRINADPISVFKRVRENDYTCAQEYVCGLAVASPTAGINSLPS